MSKGLPPGLWEHVQKILRGLFSSGVYERANIVMSLGLVGFLRNIVLRNLSGKILDVGCGSGEYYSESKRGIEVICLDPIIEDRYPSIPYIYRIVAVAERVPLRNRSVDFVVSFFAYRDFLDKANSLIEMKRVAKKTICIVDLFRPRGFAKYLLYAYLGVIAPLLAKLASGLKDYKWEMIHDTILYMPSASFLARLTKAYYAVSIMDSVSIICFKPH